MTNSFQFVEEYGVKVYPWQREFGNAFVDRITKSGGKGHFLCTAATNSGKTYGAGLCMRHADEKFGIEKYVTVVPTTIVQKGWAEDVMPFGINLTSEATNARLVGLKTDPNLHGYVVTYQQVHSNRLIFRKIMQETNSMVTFDEFHRMGENLSWGEACHEAFEHANIKLSLSATPYRMDGQTIPVQEYENEN